ncbi:hypothetical protein CEXT_298431 [Caerostris extrusa]|uniref:Uncharacterized protein n=1 Tax=Caerostris extrusa TaxID=172846 RepID=A0AAV4M7Z3_CAEEX|nr:hypothetical protein CEXT_298431 [Caerostris extrusa]
MALAIKEKDDAVDDEEEGEDNNQEEADVPYFAQELTRSGTAALNDPCPNPNVRRFACALVNGSPNNNSKKKKSQTVPGESER